jgi:hypothetical protein
MTEAQKPQTEGLGIKVGDLELLRAEGIRLAKKLSGGAKLTHAEFQVLQAAAASAEKGGAG